MTRSGDIASNIHHLTGNEKYWLVVLGDKATDSAVSRFIFGSNSSAIIDNCNAPILMVPKEAHLGEIKKIAFATDLDETEMKAMHFLKELAAVWSSRIDVVHVCREKLLVTEKVYNFDSYKKITTKLGSQDVSYMDMQEENICDGLDKYVAEYQVDLLAMFHKKRTLIKKLLHQSICKGMMNYHKVPLLIFPER
jgi:nucleotide-binding universal stress UspA family protein